MSPIGLIGDQEILWGLHLSNWKMCMEKFNKFGVAFELVAGI